MDRANALGEFLRARRDQVSPGDIGLPARAGTRRVPGLRREELASVAGLSVDYYARLEQGRERHPSDSVLDALARVLGLEPDARAHLLALAAPGAVRRAGTTPGREVGANLRALLEDWTGHPAVLIDPAMNVVGGNHLGRALFGGHRHSANLSRLTFLDPDAPVFLRRWEAVARANVAGLRAAATLSPGDPELTALIGELTVHSAEFARFWALAEVRARTTDSFEVRHPLVGDLDLTLETFRPSAAPDLQMKVYRAPIGSPTAQALALLGSLAAEHRPARSAPGDAVPRSGSAGPDPGPG